MKAPIAGALLLGLAGCGWREERRIRIRLEEHLRTASLLESQNRLVEAIAEYQAAHDLIEWRDKYKATKIEIRGLLRELEHRMLERALVTLQFEQFKTKADRSDAPEASSLLLEGRELRASVRDSGLPWLPKLDAILGKLGAAVDKK